MREQPFTIVHPLTADQVKSRPPRHFGSPRKLSPMSEMLLQGNMVFTTNKKLKPATNTFQRRGLKIKSRQDDGGTYYWVTAA